MVERTKKSSEEIKSDILNQLRSGPKTTAELGEAINSNWLTIEKFIKELKIEGLVIEVVSSPKMKVYGRADDLAYYGIPFSEEIRNKSASLLFTIVEQWKKETGIVPARTVLQKVAVALIEKEGNQLKDIPILRFHYGQMLAIRYEGSQISKHHPLNLTIEQMNSLKELIREYNGKPSSYAKLKQYKKRGMEFYLEKEENLLKGFSTAGYSGVGGSLLKLSIFYPIELKDSFPLFNKFVYCTDIILNLKDNDLRKEYFNKLKEVFYLLWETITTEYFFYDSEKYILPQKKELFNQIKVNVLNSKLSNLLSFIEDLESEVNSINPDEITVPMDEESLEIRKILAEGAEEE